MGAVNFKIPTILETQYGKKIFFQQFPEGNLKGSALKEGKGFAVREDNITLVLAAVQWNEYFKHKI